MSVVFHYTTGTCANSILHDGAILPATAYIGAGEIPVVWFSRHAHWEPTATKLLVDSITGRTQTASLAQMIALADGLYRFSMDSVGLLPWCALRPAANIRSTTARKLENSARKQGATPSDWFGSLTSVPLARVLRIERMDGGRWHDAIKVAA